MRALPHIVGAAIIGYIGIYYGNSGMMALCLVWLLFPVLGILLAWYFSRRVRVSLEETSPMADWGQKVVFRLTVENPSWIPGASVWTKLVYGHDYEGQELSRKVFWRLGARDRQEFLMECESSLIGFVHCEIRSYRVGDPFQWFRILRKSRQESRIAVLPREYPCWIHWEENREQPGEEEHYMTHLRGENPEEVFQVREYQAGDRIRNIHWKLSARAKEWIVRDFVHPGQCKLALLADFSTPPGWKTEGVNEAGAIVISLGIALLRSQAPFWLVWQDEERDGVQRVLVETEEDFYEGIWQIYQAKLGPEGTALTEIYGKLYEEDLCIGVNRKGEMLLHGQLVRRFRPETIGNQLKEIYI